MVQKSQTMLENLMEDFHKFTQKVVNLPAAPYAKEIWKRSLYSETRQKFSVYTTLARNLKTKQSPVILDLCLRKTLSGKSHDIVTSSLSKDPFQNGSRPHQNTKPKHKAFWKSSG